jgi:hypothetical protein
MKQHSQRNSIKKRRHCSSSGDFLLEVVSGASFYTCWPATTPGLTDQAIKLLAVPDSLRQA